VQRWVGPAPDAEGVLLGHEPAAGLVQVCAPADAPDGWLVAFEGYDPDDDPVVLVHADDVRLARAAVFDAVVNNADRKAGHLLPDGEGAVLGVDHGLTFHAEPKLRTVLWGWAGDPLPEALEQGLQRLTDAAGGELEERLHGLLTQEEQQALARRVRRLLARRRFPAPGRGRAAVPWPLF